MTDQAAFWIALALSPLFMWLLILCAGARDRKNDDAVLGWRKELDRRGMTEKQFTRLCGDIRRRR